MTRARAHSKGTNVLEMVKFLRARRDRARIVLPPELHPYLEKRVDVSAWYPEEEVLALTRALARLMPEEGEAVYRTLGALNARNHTEGSYGHLLGELRLETLPIRLGALWKTLHDTGELHFEPEPGRGGRAEIRGYANPGPEMCTVIGAYLAETVARAGFDALETAHTACVHRGADCCAWSFQGRPRGGDPAAR